MFKDKYQPINTLKFLVYSYMRNLNLSKEILEDLYINQNMSAPDIAIKLGCNSTTIYNNLKKYNIPTKDIHNRVNYKKFKNSLKVNASKHKDRSGKNSVLYKGGITEEYFRDLYINQNKSLKEISNITGYSETQVKRYKDKYNIVKDNNLIISTRSVKIKNTFVQKYGVSSVGECKEFKDKQYESCVNNYGVKYPMQNSSVFNKNWKGKCIKDTEFVFTNLQDLNKEYVLQHFIDKCTGMFLHHEFMEYYNMSDTSMYKWKTDNGINIPNLQTKLYTQNQILTFINEMGIPTLMNTRTVISPKEIDIYIPDNKIAIEYNGLMFHSFGKSKYSMFDNYSSEKDNYNLSLMKYNMCMEQNTHLLTIWENEWITKQDIWKSVICSHLGKNNKIYARNCEIKEVSTKEATNFLRDNHLQGTVASKVQLGLYYNTELVSLMTFGKSRYNKNYQWELLRFCNKKYINVIGGASKLLKNFEKMYNPESIISYANKRWSNGSLYIKLNFEYITDTKPNYYYFTKECLSKVYSRVSFQKHKLGDILKDYNPELSERDNMYNNNYRRIYDCGQIVFIKRY